MIGKKDRRIQPLGDNGIVTLEKIFGRSKRLNSNVGIAIEVARDEFTSLEPRQFEILDINHDISRALI